jgi:death-on-curing protein
LPSGKRHYRVTLADALGAHERALRSGGRAGIRSIDDVLSAIGRPYSGYYRAIARKAAALMQSVATNHGFIDGNKRTAIILTQLLLEQSGYALRPIDRTETLDEAIEDFVIAIVNHEYSFDEILEWFEARIR